MKKTIIYLSAAFIALGLIGFGVFKVSDKQDNAENSKSAQVSDEKAMKESTQKMEAWNSLNRCRKMPLKMRYGL